MSMSTHIVGFRPADERWNKMKSIWDACKTGNVIVPAEVEKFFNYEYPADKPGAEVGLGKAVTEWRGDMREGYQVDLKKLPPEITILRFYNSY